METHPIRREYLNPAIIPPTEDGPACWRWYAVVEFDVEQLTPGLYWDYMNGAKDFTK